MIAAARTMGLSTFDLKTFDPSREGVRDLGIRPKTVPFGSVKDFCLLCLEADRTVRGREATEFEIPLNYSWMLPLNA